MDEPEKKPTPQGKKASYLASLFTGAAIGVGGGTVASLVNATIVNRAGVQKIDEIAGSLEATIAPSYAQEKAMKVADAASTDIKDFAYKSRIYGSLVGGLGGLGFAARRNRQKAADDTPKGID